MSPRWGLHTNCVDDFIEAHQRDTGERSAAITALRAERPTRIRIQGTGTRDLLMTFDTSLTYFFFAVAAALRLTP